jgi:hypothetical protein
VTDRPFVLIQTRPGFGAGGSDEIVRLGTGVDHGDGTADVVPEIGGTPGLVDIAELTEGHGHGGFVTRLVYDDQE